jgi:CheY-like chemotaxis protein
MLASYRRYQRESSLAARRFITEGAVTRNEWSKTTRKTHGSMRGSGTSGWREGGYLGGDEQVDTIECESAEAALGTLLIGGREVAMIFADVRLRGVMDGIDLAREVKMRWPLLPVILTSGYSPCLFAERPTRRVRASASVYFRLVSLTCPSRGSRSTC